MIAAAIVRVPLDRITVGIRRRRKMGNLKSLAQSIEEHGLLHPIIVRDGKLVAGQRRLEAARLLGWSTIPTRDLTTASDDEVRAIELEENVERDDLDTYEMSKAWLVKIREAEVRLKSREDKAKTVQDGPKKPRPHRATGEPRGRKKEPGSQRDVAQETGLSKTARLRKEKHVEIAEKFPFMQRPDWKVYTVLEAGEVIEKSLTDRDHVPLNLLLDRDGIPPKRAIQVIQNLARQPPAERRAIYKLAESGNPHDLSTALTRAAQTPPLPDPAVGHLRDARVKIQKAAKETRIAGLAAEIGKLDAHLEAIIVKAGGRPTLSAEPKVRLIGTGRAR